MGLDNSDRAAVAVLIATVRLLADTGPRAIRTAGKPPAYAETACPAVRSERPARAGNVAALVVRHQIRPVAAILSLGDMDHAEPYGAYMG